MKFYLRLIIGILIIPIYIPMMILSKISWTLVIFQSWLSDDCISEYCKEELFKIQLIHWIKGNGNNGK